MRAGIMLVVVLAVASCLIGPAHAQDEAFEPPRAAGGFLNIIRVDHPGMFPEPGSGVRQLYGDARTIGDDTGEARSAEIARIKTSGIQAVRLGSTLLIGLRDQTFLKFFDDGLCGGFETCQRYTFAKFDAQRDYAIVDLSHGAGWEKILVWLRTGHCTVLPGEPMWAPSGNRFFSFGVPAPGASVAGVVDVTGTKPRVEWVEGWELGCTAEKWAGDAIVADCGKGRSESVEFIDGQWRLRR